MRRRRTDRQVGRRVVRTLTERARRVSGITLLALRASLRTKVVAALLVLLTACVLILPGIVKGDGTPEGDLLILLSYTLGFSFGILCLATLWAACSLFAAEIDSARMQLSYVKPVRVAEFWAGKWLALLALNAVLLVVVYAAVYAQVRWRMRQNGWAKSECLLSRRVTHPLLPTPREEALQTYASMRKQNALPKEISEAAVLRALEEKANERYDVLNPGEPVRWRFRLAHPINSAEPVTVRVRFDTEFSTRELVKGKAQLTASAYPKRPVEVPLEDFTQSAIEFVVDPRAFIGEGPEAIGHRSIGNGQKLSGTEQMSGKAEFQDFELVFQHTGDPKRSAALMLRSRQDVVLLTPGGSFETNLARAALIQWSVLALLAALGLTLSACFSMPVAAFTATALLMLTVVGNSVVQVISEEDEKVWQNKIGIVVSRAVHEASGHAMKAQPLTSLAHGERIDGNVIGSSAVWNVVLAPLLIAWVGCAVLRRRELAEGG